MLSVSPLMVVPAGLHNETRPKAVRRTPKVLVPVPNVTTPSVLFASLLSAVKDRLLVLVKLTVTSG